MSGTYRGTELAVNPTPGSLVVVDVRETQLVAITAKNNDVTQTLTVTIERRSHALNDFSPGQDFEDFTDIPAGETRTVDVNVGVSIDLDIRGVASGAGSTADITVVPGGRRP